MKSVVIGCDNCGRTKTRIVGDRVRVDLVKYCSEECKQSAIRKRYYEANADILRKKARDKQREKPRNKKVTKVCHCGCGRTFQEERSRGRVYYEYGCAKTAYRNNAGVREAERAARKRRPTEKAYIGGTYQRLQLVPPEKIEYVIEKGWL